ncbi:MAG: hypothetical protein ACPG06_01280 [Alphaproteobacteria bacterium]
MMKKLAHWLVRRSEKQTGEDSTFMHEIADSSLNAFMKFGFFVPMSGHRKVVSAEAWHCARVAAAMNQDCGPCTQTTVNMAISDGASPELLRGALNGGEGLTGDVLLAYQYGKAVAENGPELLDLLEAAEVRFGKEGLVELAFCVAGAAVYPTVKRALGHGLACSQVVIEPEGNFDQAA